MQQLTGYTEELGDNFLSIATITNMRLQECRRTKSIHEILKARISHFVTSKISGLAKDDIIRISTCADQGDLSFFWDQTRQKYVDDGLIKQSFSDDKVLMTF